MATAKSYSSKQRWDNCSTPWVHSCFETIPLFQNVSNSDNTRLAGNSAFLPSGIGCGGLHWIAVQLSPVAAVGAGKMCTACPRNHFWKRRGMWWASAGIEKQHQQFRVLFVNKAKGAGVSSWKEWTHLRGEFVEDSCGFCRKIWDVVFCLFQELTEEGLPFVILFHHPDDSETPSKFRQLVSRELLGEKCKQYCKVFVEPPPSILPLPDHYHPPN